MIGRILVLKLLFAIASIGATWPAPPLLPRNPVNSSAESTITLQRVGLTVTTVAAGDVLVEGQTFDFDISAIKMRISPEEMQTLIDGFNRIDFFSLKTRYRDEADGCLRTGMAEVSIMQTTSFTANGKSKSVTRYPHECLETYGSPYPRDLVALEQRSKTRLIFTNVSPVRPPYSAARA